MSEKVLKRWYVTSSWGGHFVYATDEDGATEAVEDQLREMGESPRRTIYDPEEYNAEYHGQWEGSDT